MVPKPIVVLIIFKGEIIHGMLNVLLKIIDRKSVV